MGECQDMAQKLGSHGSGGGVKTGPGSKSRKGVSGRVFEGASGGPGPRPKKSQERVSGVQKKSEFLGGHFGPEKKYLAPPPPPNSQIRCRHPPGPSAPPLLETPPLNKKSTPRLSMPRTPPSASPSRKIIYPKRPPRF